jgi:two-component system sensor histidine kinase VicK
MSISLISIFGLGLLIFGAGFWYAWHRRGRKNGLAGASGALLANLETEKAKSSIILDAIEDGVLLIDSQQVIRVFSPAAARITGWPAQEAVGLSVTAVMKLVDNKGKEYAEADNPFSRIFTEAKTLRDNKAYTVTREAKQLPINLSVSPLYDAHQKVHAAVAVFRDVAVERAEEQQRGEFISTASHEMRTPVAAIEGYLALALNEKISTIDSRARDYLVKAHSSTEHLGKLFQDLLTSAKAEDGRLTNHPAVVEIGAFLEQVTEDLRFSAEKKGMSVEFLIGNNQTIDASASSTKKVIKPLYYTWADPDRMREVITNLFDNAVKYSETGKISLGLTGDDKVVQLFVRDTGPGIPAEDVPHLFQKFYRVDSSATRTIGGTGLGLFICRKIVELYEGRIWVESTLGKGSTFFINLPRLSSQKAADLQAKSAGSAALPTITSLAN